MPSSFEPGARGNSAMLGLLAIFLLCTPFATWWLNQTPPWYLPFLGWGAVLVLCWLVVRRLRPHGL